MDKEALLWRQIAFTLRQAESGLSVAEVIHKPGVSEQTFHRRTTRSTHSADIKKKYMLSSQKERFQELMEKYKKELD